MTRDHADEKLIIGGPSLLPRFPLGHGLKAQPRSDHRPSANTHQHAIREQLERPDDRWIKIEIG
jgi:hypothetical protein